MKKNINNKDTDNNQQEEMNFEVAVKQLEEIVHQLESGELGLEESLNLFEKGIKLSRLCDQKLKFAERKIEMLTRDEKDKPHTVPFEFEDQGGKEGVSRQIKGVNAIAANEGERQ